ncbi:hypothetical protein R9D66_004272 [Citrobacter amalonaticus]|nr:hypothetical protein [Citrobacter amalonaticus]
MHNTKKIFIINDCNYFKNGFCSSMNDTNSYSFIFLTDPGEIMVNYQTKNHIVLVLDVSCSESLRKFKRNIDFINGINARVRIGVIVSRLNIYLTYYISKKLSRRVTFFNSHGFKSGLFSHDFKAWVSDKSFHSMKPIVRYKDAHYGFSLNEWLSLVVPLSGESMQEMSHCLRLNIHSLYQIRKKALSKIGLSSYREFCMMYILGNIKIENETIIRC